MRCAAADKARVTSSFAVHPRALEHAARLLWPELELQRGRARRLKLLQALQVLGWRLDPFLALSWAVLSFCSLNQPT